MIRLKRSFVLAGLLLNTAVWALDPARPLTQAVVDFWSREHGLPLNSLYTATQTPDGFLWFGTQAGLVRFDGTTFRVFRESDGIGLNGDIMPGVFTDKAGRLWASGQSGLYMSDDHEHFRQVSLGETPADNLVLFCAMLPDGSIWGNRAGGAFRYHEGKVESLGGRNLFHAVPSPDGHRVFASFPTGIMVFENGRERRLEELYGNPAFRPLVVAFDGQGRLWAASLDGLWRMDGGTFVHVLTATMPPLLNMVADPEGTMWLSYASGGGARYNLATNRLELMPGLLATARIVNFVADRDGSMWITTENDGLWRLRDGTFAMFGAAEGLPSPMVNALAQTPDGTFYAGVDHGGYFWQRGPESGVVGLKEGLAFPAVVSFCAAPDGALWIGLPNGLVQESKNGKFRTYGPPDGLPPLVVTQLQWDTKGRLWIGHISGGLSRLENGKIVSLNALPSAPTQMISASWRDPAGTLWFGTDHGLVRFADEKFTPITKADGLPEALVAAITDGRPGELWIGTDRAGFGRLRDGKFKGFPVKGLPRAMFALAMDDQERLWISSNDGISCVKLADLDAWERGELTEVPRLHYGLKDGLRSLEGRGIVGPTVLRTSDGLIRFAMGKGVASVDPRKVGPAKQPKRVFVTEAMVDGAARPPAGLNLLPGWKSLRFTYSALELAAPEKLVFATRLEGYETQWTDVERRREASYTNLAPGDYVFHVRARRTDGSGPGAEASLAFTVQPFFYQTGWFAGLCVLAVGAAFAGFYVLRLRAVRRRNAELERQVALRTAELTKSNEAKDRILAVIGHDLRGPASSLRTLTQILASEPDRFSGAELGELARGIDQACVAQLDLLNNLLAWGRVQSGDWPVQPEIIAATQPIEITRHLLGLNAREKQIELVVEGDPHLTVFADETSVCAILRNLTANAIKFTATGGQVKVSVATTGSVVTYRVQDNGVGIPPARLARLFEPGQQSTAGTHAEKGTGLGLALCRDLAALNGGQLRLESIPGQGTTALFTLPAALPPPEPAAA